MRVLFLFGYRGRAFIVGWERRVWTTEFKFVTVLPKVNIAF